MFPPNQARQLPILEVDAARVSDQADAIPRILAGTLAGVIVRAAIAKAQAEELVRAIRASGESLPRFEPPVFKGRVYGKPLVSAQDGLSGYLEEAQRFRAGCAALYPDFPHLEERIHQLMQGLARGLEVSVPRGTNGASYLPATVRVLVEGDRLPLHYENETLRSPVMAELRPALDISTLMSFYLPLAIPPKGGVLRLFWTHCLDGGDSLVERYGGEEKARGKFEARGFATVLPEVGDLLVFDGGRWYHDVTPVSGGERWTMGGFFAATRDGRAIHYWS